MVVPIDNGLRPLQIQAQHSCSIHHTAGESQRTATVQPSSLHEACRDTKKYSIPRTSAFRISLGLLVIGAKSKYANE